MTKPQKIAIASALLVLTSFLIIKTNERGSLPSVSPSPSVFVAVPSVVPSVAATPPPAVVPSVTPVPPKTAVLTSINARRLDAGVAPLTTNSTLAAMAQAHASDMVTKGYFSHTSPSGVTFQQRITAGGYSGTAFAENLGLTSFYAVEIVANWMNSEGHRVNMLNSTYRRVGIGVANGTYQGRASVFVVAIFGDK